MAAYENESGGGGGGGESSLGYGMGIGLIGGDSNIDTTGKIPPWKQELIQRKKNFKILSGAAVGSVAGEVEETVTTSAGRDIITHTPAVCSNSNNIATASCCALPQDNSSVLLLLSSSSSSSPSSTSTSSSLSSPQCTGHSHSQHAHNISTTPPVAANVHQPQQAVDSLNPQTAATAIVPVVALSIPPSHKVVKSEPTSFEQQETQLQSHSRHGTDQIATSERILALSPPSTSIVEAKKCIFNKNNQSKIKSSASSSKYTKLSDRNICKIGSNQTSNMVAMQELISENFTFDDTSEELQYGPGIVSKLRCRYLSLALRQSVGKQRPSLDNLRRATSLNNLLDEEDDSHDGSPHSNWNNRNEQNGQKARTPDDYMPGFYRQNLEQNENRRQVVRGNDSLKRARSVEALMKYDHKAWQRDIIKDAADQDNMMVLEEITGEHKIKGKMPPDIITIEDKIQNARERGEHRPKRLTSFMDETERPPPDLVKHTLRLFEATANRRPRNSPRLGNSEVAAKVATFKTIISQEKPPIVYPKPPLSPKKPVIKPRTASPKHTVNGNRNNSTTVKQKKFPSTNLEIMSIKNNLEKNNKTSPTGNNATNKKMFDDVSRSPSPLFARTDLTYRLQKSESPLTPQLVLKPINRPKLDLAHLTSPNSPVPAPRKIDPFESPQNGYNELDTSIVQLSKKLEYMSIDSPAIQSQSPADNIESNNGKEPDEQFDNMDGECQLKHISKIALANISKAGTTTEFKFSTSANKSHLPGVFNGNNVSPKKFCDNNETPGVRQIGIIRPQIKASQMTPLTSPSLPASHADKPTNKDEDSSQLNDVVKHREQAQGIEKSNRDNLLITHLLPSSNNVALTSREIEKNLINREKSEEAKWAMVAGKTHPPPKIWQHSDMQNNTMVFNFSNRKDVPDYIENDGLVIRRKRELPKPGESGFVLLGDLTVETSTDPDDSWTLGPPSPCDVEFMNDNVIIDGKSSIRDKSKISKLKIQFNDTLTKTFEYPSESSLLEEANDCANDNGAVNSKLLGNMPLGSAPLGSYTPVKASLNTNFELGVTRSQTSTPTSVPSKPKTITTSDNDPATNSQSNSNGSATSLSDISDSLQYLKPATDEQTVAWSEGTRVTDLLF